MNTQQHEVSQCAAEMEAQRKRLFTMDAHNPNRGLAMAKLQFFTLRTLYAELNLERAIAAE
jgi:hypothetical protein